MSFILTRLWATVGVDFFWPLGGRAVGSLVRLSVLWGLEGIYLSFLWFRLLRMVFWNLCGEFSCLHIMVHWTLFLVTLVLMYYIFLRITFLRCIHMWEWPTMCTLYLLHLFQLYCLLHVSNKQFYHQKFTSAHAAYSIFHVCIWCLVANTLWLEIQSKHLEDSIIETNNRKKNVPHIGHSHI